MWSDCDFDTDRQIDRCIDVIDVEVNVAVLPQDQHYQSCLTKLGLKSELV